MAVRKKNNGALAGHKFSTKKQKNQQCARGSRLGGGGALLRPGMPERNKKTNYAV
ncbi:MAG: hypothetical protein IIW17_08065 [Clostridia bacterium]|nr:hypothetical protein [Clostridia bacterium]